MTTKLEKKMAELHVRDKDLYPKLGISPSYFNEIKKGKARMSAEVLMRLAEILQCEAHEIYGNVEEPETVEVA